MKSLFREKVYAVVRAIPKGSMMSYGAVAKKAGYPGAARAVGTLMAKNHDSTIPCHRVVRSDGTVGSYNGGGPSVKKALLIKEGAIKK